MKRKKQKISPTFPCECGHSKKMHDWAGPSIGDEWCNGLGKQGKLFSYTCDCEKFKADNLKFLEQESKKKRGKLK